ncbi:hypothetical protein BT67DRAFT_286659 [Trichocladium antarcticum]|uniref:Uncharacterized protein n=1 Tax=Trichocladium antarcticum TaxID=1450529 RepID=A0AAN6UL49_9PEZI|nr:hypothetical protein BT67DRAFT_286659 [Trichocladium antarcticum]
MAALVVHFSRRATTVNRSALRHGRLIPGLASQGPACWRGCGVAFFFPAETTKHKTPKHGRRITAAAVIDRPRFRPASGQQGVRDGPLRKIHRMTGAGETVADRCADCRTGAVCLL